MLPVSALPAIRMDWLQWSLRRAGAGRTPAVRERYYAISAERRLKHPGVLAITNAPGPRSLALPGRVALRRPDGKSGATHAAFVES